MHYLNGLSLREPTLKRIIIDTDPGIDDAAAILLALASPEISVEAFTTVYGNGPVEQCADNALRILHAAGRLDIPVYRGAAKPLLLSPNEGWAGLVHGADGLGNTGLALPPVSLGKRHAVLEIIDRVMSYPGEITIVAMGRMTNVALALSLEPRLAESVAGIIVMGGALSVPGNVSPVASANLYEDPEAAAVVYSSGAPLAQVGLDVCNQVAISQAQLDRIGQANNPAAQLLTAATPCLQQYYVGQGLLEAGAGVRYNDVPAIAFAIDAGMFRSVSFYVEIETHSELSRGQTVADRGNLKGRTANTAICMEVDAPRLAALFTDRIVGYQSMAISTEQIAGG